MVKYKVIGNISLMDKFIETEKLKHEILKESQDSKCQSAFMFTECHFNGWPD